MPDTIRILIVDDQAIVRKGLRAYLDFEPGLQVVGEAADGLEAVRLAQTLQPAVILMDLVMPRGGGVEAIQEIHKRQPETRILVLTSFAEDDKIFPAIKAGALGYLLKDTPPEALVRAIHDVYRGEPALAPAVARKLMAEVAWRPTASPEATDLTERECEVLEQVARGLSNQQIADELCISERTVRNHVSHILSKLHLANRTQATLYAQRMLQQADK